MWVDVKARIGFNGPLADLLPLWLDVGSIGSASSWSGSYHVLAMGRHYDEYVVTPRTVLLPTITGFAIPNPYMRLVGKIRAAGVTGNIGEAIAAIFAIRALSLSIGDITHIRPNQAFAQRKAPDYLMRMGQALPALFQSIWPNPLPALPARWPVESKARSTLVSSRSGVQNAFHQIAAYWHSIHKGSPAEVGFGMVVSLTYHPPREVLITFFLPSDQPALLARLQALNYADYTQQVGNDIVTNGALYHAR